MRRDSRTSGSFLEPCRGGCLVGEADRDGDRGISSILAQAARNASHGLPAIAGDHANLGLIYQARGDAETARSHWTEARDLYFKIGMPHMVERVQSDLDGLQQ